MKKDKKNYNKFKRYWRLILKPQEELNNSKWRKYTCFSNLMTQSDIVNYLINIDKELLILIMMVKNFIKIICLKSYLLMNLNQLNQLMEP